MTTTSAATESAARQSQAQVAYDRLLDLLVTLQIPPGAAIGESELSDRLGVGRTPVREALNRLATERLVTIYPRRGTFAAEINIADLALISDLREELEGLAAQSAATRATDVDRAELMRLADRLGEPASRADQMRVDTDVHRAVYAAAHNHFLEESATRYHNLSMRIWYLFMDRLEGLAGHVAEHRQLITLILDGEADAARASARRHVRSFAHAVRRLI